MMTIRSNLAPLFAACAFVGLVSACGSGTDADGGQASTPAGEAAPAVEVTTAPPAVTDEDESQTTGAMIPVGGTYGRMTDITGDFEFKHLGLAEVGLSNGSRFTGGQCYVLLAEVTKTGTALDPDVPGATLATEVNGYFADGSSAEMDGLIPSCASPSLNEQGYPQLSEAKLLVGESAQVWLDSFHVSEDKLDNPLAWVQLNERDASEPLEPTVILTVE